MTMLAIENYKKKKKILSHTSNWYNQKYKQK